MNEYPLHWCVFENDTLALKEILSKTSKNEIDKRDLRGKTPLELAVFLNKYECAKILVEHGADCGVITKAGWNLVQESVSSGNADMIKLIMSYRDYQRESGRSNGIPELLNKLKQAPDFYVEMKWEFTSWIPLISKACPSDVYKIYKSGSNVRIDTTLIGFNGTSWERGNRSYIFQANNRGTATIIEIDHLLKTYYIDKLTTIDPTENSKDSTNEMIYEPDDSVVHTKLSSPNIVTFLDIDKIEFERNRIGIWGWRSDKNEVINGYDCKVYTANNLQLVTKTRVEHLNNERAKAFLQELEEKECHNQHQQANGNIPSFLRNYFQGNEQHIKIEKCDKKLTALDYFQKQVAVGYYLNGTVRRIDETQKIQTFNANLSLSDSYPLSLHEQVLPIVDLMALNNSHFKKLKEFITLQLPSGFPVKIEIPLYRVITAKVTFGNIHAINQHVEHVNTIKKDQVISDQKNINSYDLDSDSSSDTNFLIQNEDSNSPIKPTNSSAQVASKCVVDESAFKIPSNYKGTSRYYSGEQSNFMNDRNNTMIPGNRTSSAGASNQLLPRYNQPRLDDDDIMLQIAIQQSLSYSDSDNSTASFLPNLELNNDLSSVSASILPIRDSSGSTQSFQEYQERRNNLAYSQTDEDMLLQRALAESLMGASASGISITETAGAEGISNETVQTNNEDPILEVLERSRREAEEFDRRKKEDDDELQKILALSLIEK